MKLISKIGMFSGITAIFFALAACGTTTRTSSYTATVVSPVTPYYVTTATTYRTSVVKRRTCVGQSYYYQTFCPSNWRVTGYRSCYPKRYSCW